MSEDYSLYIDTLCKKGKTASRALNTLTTAEKDKALNAIAEKLLECSSEIINENSRDMQHAEDNGLSVAMIDRLKLDEDRISSMAKSIRDICALPDPIGEVVFSNRRPNGLIIHQERVPLGLVCVIFESRPNVVTDIAALCIKSGNACILRGGKEAQYSNQVLGNIVQSGLKSAGLDPMTVQVIDKTQRELVKPLLARNDQIDIVVPRGGEHLINFVTENSRIPVIKHDKGICNLYLDADADPQMAADIAVNAKVQRPGVCNSIENLIWHKDFKGIKLVLETLRDKNVELRLDTETCTIFPGTACAEEADYQTEFLELILSVKRVESMDKAIEFIHTYGSGHSEAIVTNSYNNSKKFLNQVDAACVFVNASTRFSDGGCFGLGAEVGISTQKLHVRGPMGIRDLTCLKYKIFGEGHIRS